MALKPCRECKKKVSTEATTCPKCGVPNPTRIEKYYQIPDDDPSYQRPVRDPDAGEKRINAERKKARELKYIENCDEYSLLKKQTKNFTII